MADLAEFAAQLLAGGIEVIDLTSPLHASTPILQLPPQWGQTQPFQLEEISRYDDRGPAWYWNNIRTGEHTGTHLDAPNHWVTGKDKEDVAQIPPRNLIGPAVVIDKVKEATEDPDYLLDVKDLEEWQAQVGFTGLEGQIKDIAPVFTTDLIDEINKFDADAIRAKAKVMTI